jgi:hypothetical protein
VDRAAAPISSSWRGRHSTWAVFAFRNTRDVPGIGVQRRCDQAIEQLRPLEA